MSRTTVVVGGVPYTASTPAKANALAARDGGSSAPADTTSTPTKAVRYPTPSTKSTGSSVTDAEKAYTASTQPKTLQQIQDETMGLYSTEIAGIRAAQASALAEQGKTNANEEGRTRATSAFSGTLGTDFGNRDQAEAEKTSGANTEKVRGDYELQINQLMSKANEDALAEYNTGKTNRTAALKEGIGFAQDKVSQTQAKIQSIAAAIKLDDLSQDEYDSLYANSGFNNPDEFNAFYQAAHTAALQGTKLVGDATTGYYVPQLDEKGQLTYKNVIKPIVKPTQYGAYEFDPTTGDVKTIAGAAAKIITSGGRIWSVDPKTNKAVPLTARVSGSGGGGKVGYDKANLDQQLAVHAWIESQPGTDAQKKQALQNVQSNPDYFMNALNGALGSGIYVPAAVTQDTSSADASAADAAQSAQDAADAASNAAANQDSGGEGVQ